MKFSRKKLEQARRISNKRSKHARTVDKSELSRITISPDVYATDPSRWDFPLVDTPEGWNKTMKKRFF